MVLRYHKTSEPRVCDLQSGDDYEVKAEEMSKKGKEQKKNTFLST